MKIAIVHDWVVTMGGAERVLKELTHLWPAAPVYTLFTDPRTIREHFPDTEIRTSGLQRIPGIRRIYPILAPCMSSAIESFDLSQFDTVLTSSVLFSKGIVVRPHTRHICYCYSPSRPLWDRSAAYERRGILAQAARHMLRSWDHSAAQRPDQMVAISQTVAQRIQKYYRRDALIIPPPVHMPEAVETAPQKDFFLIVARLVPHKELDMVIEAFNKLRDRLIIVGDGKLRTRLEKYANKNIEFLGTVTDAKLDELYWNCRAVIVPNEEDFGLTAVEAMAHGKPVLALRQGGSTETVLEGITGEFFDNPIAAALADGVRRIRDDRGRYSPAHIRAHAQQWSSDRFIQRMRSLVEN